jgi:hypothetical protein
MCTRNVCADKKRCKDTKKKRYMQEEQDISFEKFAANALKWSDYGTKMM